MHYYRLLMSGLRAAIAANAFAVWIADFEAEQSQSAIDSV